MFYDYFQMRGQPSIDTWVFAAIFTVAMIALLIYILYDFRKCNRGRPLQFRITDIWAMTLGLTPGFLLCTQIPREGLPIAISFMFGQIVGGIWMHLRLECSRQSSKRSSFSAAVCVFIVTVGSIALPVIVVLSVVLFLRSPMFLSSLFMPDTQRSSKPRKSRLPTLSKLPKKPRKPPAVPAHDET